MIDWVNIVLRTLMCLAFLVLVLRPMMMALIRREPNQEALEELASSAVNSAFKAWRQNADAPSYYQNPELALLALNHPEILSAAEKPPENDPSPVDAQETAQALSTGAESSTEPLAGETPTGEAQTSPAAEAAGEGEASAATGEAVAVEEEVDPDEQLQQMRDRIKQEQKKAKPTIPAELLNNANSYEDKLMVVRMIVDQERDRVAATLKRMIQVE
jgi:hypothetical protein